MSSPYITKNVEGVEWISENIPKDNSIIFAPDYISVILKSKGYRMAIYDDTLSENNLLPVYIAEKFMVRAPNDTVFLKEFFNKHKNLKNLDIYVVWGAWDEGHPLPATKFIIPKEDYLKSEYFEEVYKGKHEIYKIYILNQTKIGE